jgi:hypothetical protein
MTYNFYEIKTEFEYNPRRRKRVSILKNAASGVLKSSMIEKTFTWHTYRRKYNYVYPLKVLL